MRKFNEESAKNNKAVSELLGSKCVFPFCVHHLCLMTDAYHSQFSLHAQTVTCTFLQNKAHSLNIFVFHLYIWEMPWLALIMQQKYLFLANLMLFKVLADVSIPDTMFLYSADTTTTSRVYFSDPYISSMLRILTNL
jgi:hypothetical protein